MSPLAYGLVFGGTCFAAAIVVSVACFRAYAQELAAEDARFATQRHDGLGDPSSVPDNPWPETNPDTRQHARYAELAPERLDAEQTPLHDALVIDWLERSYTWPEVCDGDEWGRL